MYKNYLHFTKKNIVKITSVYLLLVMFSIAQLTSNVSAFLDFWSDSEIQFIDPNACNPNGTAPSATPSAGGTASGAVYMVGDSITVGAKDALGSKFTEKEFSSSYINASGGRSITTIGLTPGFKTTGLEAVAGDKERIKNAGTVVIALGTNQNNNFEDSIKDLVAKVKNANPDAKIYWVNIFSKGGENGYPIIDRVKINKSITKIAGSEGFTVIDTVSANIPLGDSIHPTPDGYKKFADIVANGASSAGSGTSTDAPATEDAEAPPAANEVKACAAVCDDGSGGNTSVPLSASVEENKQAIWDFFIGKGLKPFQVAGIMGNMSHESGFEPQRLQGTAPGVKTPANNVSGNIGWGVVQFTPASKFINPTKTAGKDPNNLGVQLDFLWQQLQGKGPVPEDARILKQIKATTTTREAVLAFQGNTSAGGSYIGYERPADQAGSVDSRENAAKEALTKYGSGSPGGSGDPGTPADSGGGGCMSGNESATGGEAPGVFDGTTQAAAQALLDNSGVKIFDDRDLIQKAANGQSTPLDPELIKLLASLAKTHDFGISSIYRGPCGGSNHCTGKAADINPTIDGQTISYSTNNPKIQKFIDDAAQILSSSCENGVPNQQYVDKTKANGSKCGVFVDIGSGPHVHLAVAP